MSEPCEAGELTAGEFFRQPIATEPRMRAVEMGDFELWQNYTPSFFEGYGGGQAKFTEPCRRSFNKGEGRRFEVGEGSLWETPTCTEARAGYFAYLYRKKSLAG